MGERQSGNGTPGRQRVHPASDTAPGSAATLELEALLRAALREGRLDGEDESRAVAAFRTARDAGAHRSRTRRRDDWRPRERRWGARSVRATLSVVLASLTLGGVAFAAIGSAGHDTHGAEDGPGRPHPAASTEARPSAPSSRPAPDSHADAAPSDRPATAKDTLAHCRAYERVAPHGKARDSTAWQRLATAAGGQANVRAYCAERLVESTAKAKDDNKGEADPKAEDTGKNDDGKNEDTGKNANNRQAEPKAEKK
ncbi:hypothetical protein AB0H86_15275 [Streptomyces sp. NPDC050997]|uniref:hypothetical protein n=1 Tax=Streptomyces sp. NPDC050997 TaxID=3155519 RepID=UPI0034206E2D